MPQHKDAKKRRRTFFARIPSTFTNKLSSVCSITDDNGKLLHSKSTYFYRWGSSRKKLSSKVTFLIPSVCGLALLVGGIVAVNPMMNNEKAYAGIVVGGNTGGSTGGTESGEATPSIALSFPTEGLPEGFNNNVEQVTPAQAGEVAYRSNIFDVTVNNSNWYAILVRAANGYTSELKNGDARVVGVGDGVKPENFANNTWGYAITTDIAESDGVLEYRTIPENSNLTPVYTGTDADNNASITKRFKLSFAAKFGGDSPSGNYMTKVYLSAVTNPDQVTELPFLGISTMQEMTPVACSYSEPGDTRQLKDTRDGKYYWVAKLRDGNCWMTQNLDFDLPADGKLFAADTNIDEDVTLTNFAAITNTTVNGAESSSGTASWKMSTSNYNSLSYYDPGLMLKTNPSEVTSCNNNIYQLNTANCPNGSSGWLDVNNTRSYVAKSSAPQYDTATNTSNVSDVLDTSSMPNIYDAHYLVGNYYSWNLATAGSGSTTTATGGTQAKDSICPRGWKLPTSGERLSQYPELAVGSLSSYNTNGSFAYLLRQYGLATTNNKGSISAEDYNVYDAPLYFLRAGWIGGSGYVPYVNSAGASAEYWSSVVFTGNVNGAFNLSFSSSNSDLNPSSGNMRFMGLTVRCVNDPSI